MLKVNLDNGETLRFDLHDEEGAKKWMEHARSQAFQDRITALTLSLNGVQYSLPKPDGFETTFLYAEPILPNGKIKGGERIICHSGDVGIVLMAHNGHRAARVNVTRQGKQRYNPLAR